MKIEFTKVKGFEKGIEKNSRSLRDKIKDERSSGHQTFKEDWLMKVAQIHENKIIEREERGGGEEKKGKRRRIKKTQKV